MGNDFVEFILLPSLMATLASEAPNLQILFKSTDLRNIEAMMANSELDLAVGYVPEPPKELIRRTLFHEPLVCVARRGRPPLHHASLWLGPHAGIQPLHQHPRNPPIYRAPSHTATPR